MQDVWTTFNKNCQLQLPSASYGARRHFYALGCGANAYQYLNKYKAYMDYQEDRRLGLPIGSSITTAACKTVFTQRFKQSGTSWRIESRESGDFPLSYLESCLSGGNRDLQRLT